MVGWIGDCVGVRMPVASVVFSFCVASVGMGIGVMVAPGLLAVRWAGVLC